MTHEKELAKIATKEWDELKWSEKKLREALDKENKSHLIR